MPEAHGGLSLIEMRHLEQVLPGNGAAELIWLAAQAFVRAGEPVVVVGPSFGEYERAARAAGGRVFTLRAEPPEFRLEVGSIVDEAHRRRPVLVCLCNPNNPTGQHLAEAEVAAIAAACGNGRLVLDEAYRSFVAASPFAPPPAANVVVLRSMTKDFALAGLRLGYALAEPRLVEALSARQPPWSVSAAAQAAGIGALDDLDHLKRTLALTRQASVALRLDLAEAGAQIVPSPAHFLLISVGDGGERRRQVMGRGCLVRDCASFGLPAYVRVGARTPEENRRLVEAWRELA